VLYSKISSGDRLQFADLSYNFAKVILQEAMHSTLPDYSMEFYIFVETRFFSIAYKKGD